MLLEVKEKVLIVDISKEVTIHQEDSIIVEVLHELDTTYGTKELRFTNCLYLYVASWFCKVLFELLFEVVDSYREMTDTIADETINVIVNNALITNL